MNAPDVKAVVDALKAGAYDLVDLYSIHAAARAAYVTAVDAKKKGDIFAHLSDWDSHKQMLDELMNNWDDHTKSAFVDSLLTLARGDVGDDDDIKAMIKIIIDAASEAAKIKTMLASKKRYEDEYYELYLNSLDKMKQKALDGLQKFWNKYVKKAGTRKSTKNVK